MITHPMLHKKSEGLIQLGMNGRFFANNWRPAADEIAFTRQVGFQPLAEPIKT